MLNRLFWFPVCHVAGGGDTAETCTCLADVPSSCPPLISSYSTEECVETTNWSPEVAIASILTAVTLQHEHAVSHRSGPGRQVGYLGG